MGADSFPQSPVQKCIRVIAFFSTGSSVGGSSEELQLIGVQRAVFSLAEPSGDTDWSPEQEFGLAELLKRQAGFSTRLGLSWRDPGGWFSHPGSSHLGDFSFQS